MTIRPVHRPTGYAYTPTEYAELMANRTRPLTGSGHIGSNPTRRNTDAAASSAFTDPDRPATSSRRRAVGPRRYPTGAETARVEARKNARIAAPVAPSDEFGAETDRNVIPLPKRSNRIDTANTVKTRQENA